MTSMLGYLLVAAAALGSISTVALVISLRRRNERLRRILADLSSASGLAGSHDAEERTFSPERALEAVVKRLQESERTVRMSQLAQNALFSGLDHAGIALAFIDSERRILEANAFGLELFSEPHIYAPIHEATRSTMEVGLQLSLSRRRIDVAGPPRRAFELLLTPIDASDSRLGCIVLAKEITDVVVADETRRDFVANVSHELKTPVGALQLSAELLADIVRDPTVTDPETIRSLASNVHSKASALATTIERLLELSKLETAEEIRTDRVDLDALVARVVRETTEAASQKDVAVLLRAGAGARIVGNESLVFSAVWNLVTNAVQYSRPGGRVEVRVEPRGENVVVEVRDEGVGIPEGDLERIFERFYTVKRPGMPSGTGLGLSIAKHVAVRHGGSIEVESTEGEGSTFRLLLPSEPTGSQDGDER